MHVAYLFATAVGGAIWLACFFSRKDLRKVMLSLSVLGLPLALSDIFYVPQYWRPQTIGNIPVGIEGFLFSFEAAGICSVLYAIVLFRRFQPPNLVTPISVSRVLPRALLLAVPLPVSALVALILHSNLEWGLYVGLLLTAILVGVIRPDLFRAEILGGLVFLPVYALALVIWITAFPSVHDWFTLRGLPHWYFLRVPLSEIVFGFFFAAYWTAVYPFAFDRSFVRSDSELAKHVE